MAAWFHAQFNDVTETEKRCFCWHKSNILTV